MTDPSIAVYVSEDYAPVLWPSVGEALNAIEEDVTSRVCVYLNEEELALAVQAGVIKGIVHVTPPWIHEHPLQETLVDLLTERYDVELTAAHLMVQDLSICKLDTQLDLAEATERAQEIFRRLRADYLRQIAEIPLYREVPWWKRAVGWITGCLPTEVEEGICPIPRFEFLCEKVGVASILSVHLRAHNCHVEINATTLAGPLERSVQEGKYGAVIGAHACVMGTPVRNQIAVGEVDIHLDDWVLPLKPPALKEALTWMVKTLAERSGAPKVVGLGLSRVKNASSQSE